MKEIIFHCDNPKCENTIKDPILDTQGNPYEWFNLGFFYHGKYDRTHNYCCEMCMNLCVNVEGG